eukprot:8445480-Prorocentrum_lima.AAC.1
MTSSLVGLGDVYKRQREIFEDERDCGCEEIASVNVFVGVRDIVSVRAVSYTHLTLPTICSV